MKAKEEIIIEERISLIEKELNTLTGKVDEVCGVLKELEDIKLEIKGLKLFLGRECPEFKGQFPEIVKKVSKKK